MSDNFVCDAPAGGVVHDNQSHFGRQRAVDLRSDPFGRPVMTATLCASLPIEPSIWMLIVTQIAT